MSHRTVVVNGVAYRVVARPREALDGGDSDGICFTEQTLIVLARDLSPAQAKATLYHEIGHAAVFESGFAEIVKDYSPNPDRLEELMLQTFAPVYRQALGVK